MKNSNVRQALWRKRNPWARYVEWARRRCSDTNPDGWWPNYGAKGIRVELTAAQLKPIWERDNAAAMRKPSLDRIDERKNYAPDNVRFIEFALNTRRAWDPRLETVTPEFT